MTTDSNLVGTCEPRGLHEEGEGVGGPPGGGWDPRPRGSHFEFPSVKLCDGGAVRPA